jgi:hypothetical protein
MRFRVKIDSTSGLITANIAVGCGSVEFLKLVGGHFMSQSRDADVPVKIEVETVEPVVGKKRRFAGDWLDIFLTFAVIVAAIIAIASFVSQMPKQAYPVLLLAGTTAGVLGWGAGVMFSPYGGRDQLSSRGTGRLLTGLIVGFAVAWFWGPIKEFFASCGPAAGNFFSSGLFPIAAISLIVFLLMMISTYVLRSINREGY